MRVRTELRLFLQALNHGWDVPEAERDKARATAEAVLSDPQTNKSERHTAELVLSRMEAQGTSQRLSALRGCDKPDHAKHSPSVR